MAAKSQEDKTFDTRSGSEYTWVRSHQAQKWRRRPHASGECITHGRHGNPRRWDQRQCENALAWWGRGCLCARVLFHKRRVVHDSVSVYEYRAKKTMLKEKCEITAMPINEYDNVLIVTFRFSHTLYACICNVSAHDNASTMSTTNSRQHK